jgi:glycosyltransferase involved in cell wall biosynthesis
MNRKTGRLAVFLATSGHSGVDRVMKNLLPAIADAGVNVDLLHVNNHGPYMESSGNLRVIELGSSHAYSSLPALVRYLRREMPDVLLSDKDRVNRVAILAKTLSGVSTRVVVRMGTTVSLGLAARRPMDRFLTRVSMKYLYRRSQKIILPSKAAVDDFIKVTGIPAWKVEAVPSPVATPELYQRASETVQDQWFQDRPVPIVVGIGELCRRKDFDTLLRAFALVRKKREARLVIFGEGRRRRILENLAKELDISKDVLMPGFHDNPYPFLARADLYVHSSRQEGSPVALMEAIALGVPCVSTDCPSGPSEILQGGRYGHLVPVGNSDTMAEAMIEYLNSPPAKNFIREAALPFTLETSIKAYLKALDLRFFIRN